MKESTTWPSSVPESWTKCKAQYVLLPVWREPLPGDEIITAFRDGEVTLRRNRREEGFTNALKEIGYQHISRGDLVVHSMDGGFGAIGVSDSDGKASPVVHAYRSKKCDVHFVAYFLRAAIWSGWIAANGKGIRERSTQFDRSALSRLEIAFPSLLAQRTITEYLDRETGEIDAMIAQLNSLAELLMMRRDRDIETLLDELPDGTKWVPSKFLVRIQTGSGDTKDASEDGQHPFYVRSQTPLTHEGWEFEGDAVLTAGDGAGVGKVFHFVTGKFMAHQRVYVLNEFNGVLPAYYFHMFKHLFPAVATDGTAKATVDSVRLRMIADLRVPVPSFDEQRRIADHLDAVTSQIDAMLGKVSKLKELLTERRAALITDVVTGKKEVA